MSAHGHAPPRRRLVRLVVMLRERRPSAPRAQDLDSRARARGATPTLGAGRRRIVRPAADGVSCWRRLGGAVGTRCVLSSSRAPSFVPAALLPDIVTLALSGRRVLAFCAASDVFVGSLFGSSRPGRRRAIRWRRSLSSDESNRDAPAAGRFAKRGRLAKVAAPSWCSAARGCCCAPSLTLEQVERGLSRPANY